MVSPPQLTTGRAVCQFFAAPGVPFHGTVTFTASVSHASAPVAVPNPFTVLPEPRKGVFDSEGFLIPETGAEGEVSDGRGVTLIAADNPVYSTIGWHWIASVRQTDEKGNWLATLPSFPVHILTGQDTDLSRSMRLPAGNVISVDQSKALADAAERHAAEAKGFAGEAAESSAEAVKAAESAVVEVREFAGQVAGKLDADTADATFQTKTAAEQAAEALTAAVAEAKAVADAALANGGATITPDPNNPGLYIIPAGGQIKPDPANPGLYFIGA